MKKQTQQLTDKPVSKRENPIKNGFPLQCEWCGKTVRYTLWEIDEKKKKEPYPAAQTPPYYIPCPSCHDGYMFSVEPDEFLEDFLACSCICDHCDEN